MKVYRIENEKGIGPFRGSRLPLSDACQRHPGPTSWGVYPKFGPEDKFAFTRLDTLEFVFEGCMDELSEAGFTIVELDVEPLCEGPQNQVIFRDERVWE
jgi:hypothetical protein